MKNLPAAELKRLRTQLHKLGLDEQHEAILSEAQPAVSLFAAEVTERDKRLPLERIPVGASRFGGVPDLPGGTQWPEGNSEPLTFILQLSLPSLPAVPDSPLPSKGMLWLFHGTSAADDAPKPLILWKDCEPSACVRQPRRAESDAIDFREYEPFAIESVAAHDFPPADSRDDRPKVSGPLPESYGEFVAHARDPHLDRRRASGYPYAWHYIGQLLGVTSPGLQRNGRAHFQRLLSLENNPMTDFNTLIDAAPLHYMIEARQASWTRFDSVIVASAL